MRRAAGFTLIELLITITIMVILLALTVVSLRNNQASARDEERKTDILAIAQQLENYYQNGSDTAGAIQYNPGEYPPTAYMNTEDGIKAALRDIDPNVLRAPNVAVGDPISLTVATSATAPTPANANTYIYQPIDRDGALCDAGTDFCSKFTIFYKIETSASVQSVTSKHQ